MSREQQQQQLQQLQQQLLQQEAQRLQQSKLTMRVAISCARSCLSGLDNNRSSVKERACLRDCATRHLEVTSLAAQRLQGVKMME